ncbi:hypothetical protein A6B43_02965 [Vespertiliibacter pulmonis]|uniref:DUF3298 domain-containing protein n=1 Tax=Vespertiliibacter pulmonis TaxID=1443036 RepID=A0A3N4VU50_9PAST|nr:DUF3298 domain-containing protein [Vespertiliibacter pulmonis]QLB20561.1 hypothetical protein A6B43_02965 [Vespertiliibacter pulmonis]RPE82691.1 hypothetical protein EDC46_1362 [Vespertiliibacter pulmonis]
MNKVLLGPATILICLLVACDRTSLVEASKRLDKLEANYNNLEQNLRQKEQELLGFQENSIKKVENCSQQVSPLVKVETVKLFEKIGSIKLDDLELENRRTIFISAVKTNIEWIDELLRKNIWLYYSENKSKAFVSQDDIRDFFDKYFEGDGFKDNQGNYFENHIEVDTQYIGQRNNIVTFSQRFSYDAGGSATYVYDTDYLNIDLNKKAIIRLDDLVSPHNQTKLRDILWEHHSVINLNGKYVSDTGMDKKENFYISKNFYFTSRGIHFVYPVHEVGVYWNPFLPEYMNRRSERELIIPFYEIEELINQDYR